jgi:hypothetical protein
MHALPFSSSPQNKWRLAEAAGLVEAGETTRPQGLAAAATKPIFIAISRC